MSEDSRITTKEVVLRLEDKVDALIESVAEVKGSLAPTVAQVADHELRLRSLERFRFSVPSTAVLSLVVAFGTLLYTITN